MIKSKIINKDCLKGLEEIESNSVNLIVTSPPYFGCRQYDPNSNEKELGRESNPKDYIQNIFNVSKQLKRVLKEDGSFYLNIGDVYFGTKGFSRNKGKYERKTDHHYKEHKIAKEDGKYLQHKQLLMLPSRIAIEMQDDGWILRNSLIWEKANPIPSFSKDRRLPVYENIFHFVKSKKYYFDYDKAKELNHHRDVIKCNIEPYKNHQATFPEKLIEPLILTTSREGDVILDPFNGSGTTGAISVLHQRNYIGIELLKEYCDISKERIDSYYNSNLFNENKLDTKII
jgi:site-specific DNA-methyltransferase (cytosine-N4-specific)